MKQPINQRDSSKVYCEGLGNVQSCHLWSSVQDKPDQKAIVTQTALVYVVFLQEAHSDNAPGNMLKRSPRSVRNKQRRRLGVMQRVLCSGRVDTEREELFQGKSAGFREAATSHLKPWLVKALAWTDGQQHPAASGFHGG